MTLVRFSRLLVLTALVMTARFVVADQSQSEARRNGSRDAHALNAPHTSPAGQKADAGRVTRDLSKLPIVFERNEGQLEPGMDFVSRGRGYGFYLQPGSALMALQPGNGSEGAGITMRFAGGSTSATASAEQQSGTKTNYLIGRDPAKWHRNVASYERVRYAGLYPGIDVVYYGNGEQLEYDLVVAPGADPADIALTFDGTSCLHLDSNGDLLLGTGTADIRQLKPVAYQADGERREIVDAEYVLTAEGEVRFALGSYDRERPLVIDPIIVYSTFLGGAMDPVALAVTSDGSAIVYGDISVQQATTAALDPLFSGGGLYGRDTLLVKMSPDGQQVRFMTYIGGSGVDRAKGVAVNAAGSIFLIGTTTSLDLPTTSTAFDPNGHVTWASNRDSYILKVAEDGSVIVWGSYLRDQEASAVAVDANDQAIVVGVTAGVATTTAQRLPYPRRTPGSDAIVTKFSADGSGVDYSLLFGGRWGAGAKDVAVDAERNVYVAGTTSSDDFPVLNAAQTQCRSLIGACMDVFVMKLDPAGRMLYSTFLGGSDNESAMAIAVTPEGAATVMGSTASRDLPLLNAFMTSGDGTFVAGLTRDGALRFSTYWGPRLPNDSNIHVAYAMDVDSSGNIMILGDGWDTLVDVLDGTRGWPIERMALPGCFPKDIATHGSARVYVLGWVTNGGYPMVNAQDRFAGNATLAVFDRGASGPQVGIGGVAPRAGLARGGTSFGIYPAVPGDGNRLPADCRAYFDNIEAAGASVWSDGVLRGYTPAHPAGAVEVKVTCAGSGASYILADAFRFVEPMTITGVTPGEVPAAQAARLRVTGTNFTPGITGCLTVGNGCEGDVSINWVSSEALDVWVRGGGGPWSLQLVNDGGGRFDTEFTAIATSAITFTPPGIRDVSMTLRPEFSPAIAYVDGNQPDHRQLEAYVGCVDCLPGVTWEVEGITGGLSMDSLNRYYLQPPAHAAGPVDVTVRNTDGRSSTLASAILYIPRPADVVSISPSSGRPTDRTAVTITGANFRDGARVLFDGVMASDVVVVADTIIQCTAPVAEPGSADVVVQNREDIVTGAPGTFAYTGPYLTRPLVPEKGSITGGTQVRLEVIGYVAGGTVSFGGAPATITAFDGSILLVNTPPHEAGKVDVVVTNPDGTTWRAFGAFVFQGPGPVISNVSPTFGPVEGGRLVTITGANFASGAWVQVGALLSRSVTVIDSSTLTFITTERVAGVVAITVINPDGLSVTATGAYTYVAPPAIQALSPAAGPATGGTSTTITGSNFANGATVTFGGIAATSVTFTSSSSLTVVTPAHAVGDVDVVVTNPGDISMKRTNGFRYLPPAPTITSFTPTVATVDTTVTITGTDFTYVTGVTFATNVAALYVVNSPTQITATVPAGAVTGPIKVTTQSGTATSTSSFNVDTPGAVVDGFTPSSGAAGALVTITGLRFTGATSVKFGGVAAESFVIDSATQITATVPADAFSGSICVTTPLGQGCSAQTFTAAPRVTGFTPVNALPGENVTIDGANLAGATAVAFTGGDAATLTVNAAGTAISTTVPAAATTGPVTVVTPGGSVTSSIPFGVRPAITGFTPSQGGAGTRVVLTGQRLSGATTVRFGGTNGTLASSFTVDSDTQVTAVIPGTANIGTICITTPGGTGCSAGSFGMSPSITGFSPAAALPGASVTIAGANFTDATAVSFNGAAATPFTVVSATSITTTVPLDATTGPVTVTTASGSGTSTTHFGVLPKVTSFTPSIGGTSTQVTITGERLTGAVAVQFGGFNGRAATSFTVNSATEIVAVTPAAANSGPICVTTPAGLGCSTSTFTTGPYVSSLNPNGGLPGDGVTITGGNFTGATAVSFNGVAPDSFTVASPTVITTTVPADATTGPVSVTTPAGTGTSPFSFGVSPVITSFAPAIGGPGTPVTITGLRLTDTTSVRFYDSATATFTVNSATQITAVVPQGATTGAITVSTLGGSAFSGVFTMGPKITYLSPAAGATIGATVGITGSGFTGATAVSFNGTRATAFTVTSSTTILATVPAGATTGPVLITTAAGSATSASPYTIFHQPAITALLPQSAEPGAEIAIEGTNLNGATMVMFTNNAAAASYTAVSSSRIIARVPALAANGVITVTTPGGTATSPMFTVLPLSAPSMIATAVASTVVDLAWSGAVQMYQVQRATSLNGPFSTLATVTAVTYRDSAAQAGRTYFYRIVRVSNSQMSNVDMATTVMFSDDPIGATSTVIKAAHLAELRTAINAVRSAANLGPASWTDDPLAAGATLIRAGHLVELRTALAAALSGLGRPYSFSTAPAAGDTIRAVHVQELRDALK